MKVSHHMCFNKIVREGLQRHAGNNHHALKTIASMHMIPNSAQVEEPSG